DVATDDVLCLNRAAAFTPLVDEAKLPAEHFRVNLRAFHIADVRRNENPVAQLQLAEPFHGYGRCAEMIDRDIEKALHLAGVEVNCDDPVRSRSFEEIGDELGRDRRSTRMFLILSRVAEVGDDRRYARGAGALEAIDPDEQFHQV